MPYSYKHPIHPHPMPPIPASTQPTQQDYIRERNSATELLFLRFMPDTPIDDPSTSAGSLWAQALDSIRGSAEQQARPGFGRLYWGRVEREGTGHEDGDGVVLMIGECAGYVSSIAPPPFFYPPFYILIVEANT